MFQNRKIIIATKHEKEQVIAPILEKELGVKIVFMGFGLDSDNLHSPNEKFNIENFYKGIETIPYFHQYFTEMSQ
jgi:acetylornithine deacetylase/succinyl-diaminopimelate desuccinylase-like protein